MNEFHRLEELYWQELGVALRAMVGPGVVLSAACAAALTLTGAAAHPAAPACQACLLQMPAPAVPPLPTT